MNKIISLAFVIFMFPSIAYATARVPSGQMPNLPPLQQIDFGVQPNYSNNIQTEDQAEQNSSTQTHSTEQSFDKQNLDNEGVADVKQVVVPKTETSSHNWLTYLIILFLLMIIGLATFLVFKNYSKNIK